MGYAARSSAGLIAAIAWIGIAIHFHALRGDGMSLAATLWTLLRFFTITTNLLVALLFTWLALGGRPVRRPKLLVSIALAILLVGVVYELLLSGLVDLTAGSATADVLLHRLTQLLVPLFWLAFVPKGHLGRRDPFLWTLYPLAYLGYALARGAAEGRYAYPFIDVARNGWPTVAFTCLIIAAGFVLAGWLLVAIDRALAGMHMRS